MKEIEAGRPTKVFVQLTSERRAGQEAENQLRGNWRGWMGSNLDLEPDPGFPPPLLLFVFPGIIGFNPSIFLIIFLSVSCSVYLLFSFGLAGLLCSPWLQWGKKQVEVQKTRGFDWGGWALLSILLVPQGSSALVECPLTRDFLKVGFLSFWLSQ